MRIKRVLLLLITLIAASIIFLAGCGNKAEGETTTIRFAHFPNITHSQALVGKANGEFQKALGDIKIDWKAFNAGPSEIEALLAGEVDLGYIGPGPAINGYVKSGGELQVIAGATDAGAILVARKDAPISSVKDLDGKKVAVPQFGNTQDLSLRNLLQDNGLKDTTKGGTVEIRQAENPDIKVLLDKGEIDAALVPEPWGSRLIKEVGAKVVLDASQVWRDGKYSTAVLIVRTEFLEKHPDLVQKLVKTHVELTDFINQNPDEAKQLVNSQIGELTGKSLPQDVLSEAFTRLKVTYNPERESVTEMVNLSVKAGFLKEKPDTSKLFNLDILNQILKAEGLDEVK